MRRSPRRILFVDDFENATLVIDAINVDMRDADRHSDLYLVYRAIAMTRNRITIQSLCGDEIL